jgi:hypothetical protein
MISTFKNISEKLSNKQRYNLVVNALRKLEGIHNYGTIDDPYEIMSCMYKGTTVAKYIIENGEINIEGFEYGIIIDLREDMIYVDYPTDYGQKYEGNLANYEYDEI